MYNLCTIPDCQISKGLGNYRAARNNLNNDPFPNLFKKQISLERGHKIKYTKFREIRSSLH